jgi:hypothetical protein
MPGKNEVSITISAKDDASKALKDLNKETERFVRESIKRAR